MSGPTMWICAAGDLSPLLLDVVDFVNMFLFRSVVNLFPSGNGPFSDEQRSPRAYFLDVRAVRLVVNPCAALLIEKIAHFQIGNKLVLSIEKK
jgi:hypothetical protein